MNKELTHEMYAYHSDGFIKALNEYMFSKNESVTSLKGHLRDRQFRISNAHVSYRNINHWEEVGLLSEFIRNEEKGWRRFTLLDLIWIKVIEHFRSFGVGLEEIKKIKESFEWDKKAETYPFFEFAIVQSIFSKDDHFFYLTLNGEAGLIKESTLQTAKTFHGASTMLTVSLKHVLSEVIKKDIPIPTSLHYVSEPEMAIIYAMRAGDYSEINLKNKLGKPHILKTKKKIKGDQSKKLIQEVRSRGSYGEILTRIEKGYGQVTELIEKTKL